MGRPKGGKNREWSKEQKLEVINYFFSGHTQKETCAHFRVVMDQLRTWINRYNEKNSKNKEYQNLKKKGYFDWICNRCKNLNYSFRKICNKCNLPKNKNIFYNSSKENFK